MKKIIIAAVTLPLIIASSISFANEFKPTGWYLKGYYDNYIHSHNHSNALYGAGVGYKFNALRAEGKYGYGQRSSGHTNSLSLLGYLDLDNCTPFSPYVGLGIEKNFNNYNFNINTNDLHAVGTVGTRAYLNRNIAMDVGYVAPLNSNLSQGRATLGLVYQF